MLNENTNFQLTDIIIQLKTKRSIVINIVFIFSRILIKLWFYQKFCDFNDLKVRVLFRLFFVERYFTFCQSLLQTLLMKKSAGGKIFMNTSMEKVNSFGTITHWIFHISRLCRYCVDTIINSAQEREFANILEYKFKK